MKLTNAERETVIRCSAIDKEWEVVTADDRIIRRLKKRGYKVEADKQMGNPYVKATVPFGRVSILGKRAVESVVSEAFLASRRPKRPMSQEDKNKKEYLSSHEGVLGGEFEGFDDL